LAVLAAASFSSSASAADFVWNQTDSPNDWSLNTNWTPTAAAGGPSAAGLSVLINTNIAATSTINLFTLTNPGTAIKTIGILDIGDTNGTHSYTLATGTGAGILNFDGNGSNAQLNQLSTSKGDTISAPITLSSSLDIANASANTLTLSTGGISSATTGLKTITNSGSGTGGSTLSGIIGNGGGSVAVVQNSATSILTLSGANTFSGGVTIQSGTLVAGNNAAALGTGAVLLGDTSGNKDATLRIGNSFTYANAITVQAGSSGNLIIEAGALNKAVLSGGITLNNNLTLNLTAAGGGGGVSTTTTLPYLTVSGEIGGTKNLTLNATGLGITSNATGQPAASGYTISGAITTTGSVTDASTGQIWKTISGNISNISALNKNGANSTLILSGTNTYTGPTNVNAGVLRITGSNALQSTPVTVASGGTLQLTSVTVGSGQTLTLSGQGTSFTAGALDTTNNGTYAGSIILAADATIAGSLVNTTLTVSGGITGAEKTLTVGGVGNTTISGTIATTTGGLTKTGTGILTLSGGSNSYAGVTRISNGILSLTHASALGGGGDITFDGGILRHNSTNEVDYGSRIANSTGPVSIDTNGRNVTYATSIAASNSGGLSKLGTGSLTLSGTNLYTGITAINAGTLAYTAAGAISAGGVWADAGGTLNSGGAYANVQAWLGSGAISQPPRPAGSPLRVPVPKTSTSRPAATTT
jgi:autotransporter-associated beta strand protein